jgi:surfeit locus 1 family protein
VWQWDRAAYKRGLLAAYAEQGARKPVSLDALLRDPTLESLPPYLRVTATGHYDPARQILLEDMTRGEEVGYEVLTPFMMQGGVIALVDRGWIPVAEDDVQGSTSAAGGRGATTVAPGAVNIGSLPDIAVSDAPRQLQAVIGTLPVPGLRLGQPAKPAAGWPKLLFYPVTADLVPLYGPKLMTPVLHLDPSEPDGYGRELTLDVGFPPERHLAYAFQWVMLALAVFAVWLVVNFRRRKQTEAKDG